MKAQTQKHLGQSVGFAALLVGTSLAIVVLMVSLSGGWQ